MLGWIGIGSGSLTFLLNGNHWWIDWARYFLGGEFGGDVLLHLPFFLACSVTRTLVKASLGLTIAPQV